MQGKKYFSHYFSRIFFFYRSNFSRRKSNNVDANIKIRIYKSFFLFFCKIYPVFYDLNHNTELVFFFLVSFLWKFFSGNIEVMEEEEEEGEKKKL